MGIPVFFKTLLSNYETIIEPVNNQKMDNLFFDLNCLIHPCCSKINNGDETEMINLILSEINKLIELREELKKKVPKDSIFDPPYSTLSVGGIFGGIAHNVISDKCHVKWETRPVVKDDAVYLNAELDKYVNEILLPDMKKVYPDSKISKEIIGEIIGFDRDEKSEACEFVSSITGDNSREVVSFGTEAGLFQEIGISTAVCGPGSIEQAHKIDEFIKLEEIKKCLNFLNGVKDKSIQN